MTTTIVNRETGETLLVELALGEDVWLFSRVYGHERAKLSHFPPERWRFEDASAGADDNPVPQEMTAFQRSRAIAALEAMQ